MHRYFVFVIEDYTPGIESTQKAIDSIKIDVPAGMRVMSQGVVVQHVAHQITSKLQK